jgi:hypothetical protein
MLHAADKCQSFGQAFLCASTPYGYSTTESRDPKISQATSSAIRICSLPM